MCNAVCRTSLSRVEVAAAPLLPHLPYSPEHLQRAALPVPLHLGGPALPERTLEYLPHPKLTDSGSTHAVLTRWTSAQYPLIPSSRPAWKGRCPSLRTAFSQASTGTRPALHFDQGLPSCLSWQTILPPWMPTLRPGQASREASPTVPPNRAKQAGPDDGPSLLAMQLWRPVVSTNTVVAACGRLRWYEAALLTGICQQSKQPHSH